MMALARQHLYDDKRSVFHTSLALPRRSSVYVAEFLIGYVYGLAVLVWLALVFYTP
jgi:hypothetical protein